MSKGPQEDRLHLAFGAVEAYLREEIAPLDLANLLDGHLHDMVEWIAQSGQPISEEQRSTYHHLRGLRDLLVAISDAKPAAR